MRILRWLGIAAGLLILAVGVIWAIGSLLPVEHRASVSGTIPGDADLVWRRVSDPETWSSWRGDLTRVEVLSESSVRVTGQGETLRYRVERPGPRTLVTVIANEGLPFGGRWIWTVEPAGDGGATVTIVEEGEVTDPFFRFFSRFVFGHESSLRTALDQLQESFEPRS